MTQFVGPPLPTRNRDKTRQQWVTETTKQMTGKGFKLPKGCVYAYVVCNRGQYTPLYMFFTVEQVANCMADYQVGCNYVGVVASRIAVMNIDSEWHKVGIVPIDQKAIARAKPNKECNMQSLST
jgi:hypothetical protein